MLNVLLDGFPESYKGYTINTDFRVGILLTLLQEDETIDDELKGWQMLNLLYKDVVPEDSQIALDGLIWFLSCGRSEMYFEDDEDADISQDKALDFTVDHLDIWAAFKSIGVDLEKEQIHWFKFVSLLGCLGECTLTQKMQFRTTDLTKMKGDTRSYYLKLKNKYKVRKVISKEEHEEQLKQLDSMPYYKKLYELNKRT